MAKVTLVLLVVLVFVASVSARPKLRNPYPEKIDLSAYGGVFGLDISAQISQIIPQSGWQCLNQQGNYSFAIIQGWQGGYGQNQYLATAVSNAWAGGMSHVDVYAFMCNQCSGNGVGAVDSLISYLQSNGVQFGMVWLDVEQCNGCWSYDMDSNCNWVSSLAQEYINKGINIGIYSSPGEWPQTVGSDCTDFTNLPLWYAHYDGDPSFDDWSSVQFGGWSSPSIKQFADSAGNSCGYSIDRDWYP